MAEVSDAEVLVASVRDPLAFTVIYDRHAATLHRFLVRRVGPDEGEALLGDLFRVAFERRATFDEARTSALPWLYGIGANLLRSHRRREGRRLRAVARLVAESPPVIDIDGAVDAAALMPAVVEALGSLSADEREALLLYAWEELAYADIASVLDVPVGTVRSRISRARAHLRELLPLTDEEQEGGVTR